MSLKKFSGDVQERMASLGGADGVPWSNRGAIKSRKNSPKSSPSKCRFSRDSSRSSTTTSRICCENPILLTNTCNNGKS